MVERTYGVKWHRGRERLGKVAVLAQYAVANADIAHQRVDDEVIVINLQSGAYFSLRGVAADAWSLLASGVDIAEAAAVMAGRYAARVETVETDLEAYVAQLCNDGLLLERPGGDVAPVELPDPALGPVYTAPLAERYDDMAALLLLDPIHDVDAAGWPVVATDPADE